ncbi:uncharacterized protein PHALS_11030 [Plasmopara halstedii]|uniref:Uncharacterized protein n=1 Tax=Plasmopara halstedii TaxID=4781 RepID=A0A0N7L595_PLAHL|nr:uncharacterized protein PHALS_11030 [Plasmopara halstedii]CEG40851.1 hypothetical protein PHALS_11030 [Plasmopara halstedii]|eukprot:XP_024577220.1 hypothetical protein PHALS_11030 [Plasmopara halstedii]
MPSILTEVGYSLLKNADVDPKPSPLANRDGQRFVASGTLNSSLFIISMDLKLSAELRMVFIAFPRGQVLVKHLL